MKAARISTLIAQLSHVGHAPLRYIYYVRNGGVPCNSDQSAHLYLPRTSLNDIIDLQPCSSLLGWGPNVHGEEVTFGATL